jgi:Subtilase family
MITRPRRRHPRPLVAAAAGLAVAVLCFVQAAPASALPKGAYWYGLWELPNVWKTTEGAGVTVAVIDSGVKASLGDLQGQVLPGLDLSTNHTGAQNDVPDPGQGNFGHGTDMAVLIAGTGKGGGLVGVAPKARILPINVSDDQDQASTAAAAQGVRWAVDHGAKIVNLSFAGTGECDPTLGQSIKYAYQHDVIVVAGAGDSPGPVGTPADCPGAIAVGGDDINFKPWTQTPSGPTIDFVAPSFNLVNELLDGTLNGPQPGNAGTSQATALVSGVFALIRAKFPHDTARQIVTRALYAVHNGLGRYGPRINDTLGYGEIVPKLAVTTNPPANAKNPIYDRFDTALGTAAGGGSSSPPTSSSSTNTPAPASTSPSSAASSSNDSSSGFPAWAVIVIIVVVLAIIVAVVAISRRNRRNPPGGPPPSWPSGPPSGTWPPGGPPPPSGPAGSAPYGG